MSLATLSSGYSGTGKKTSFLFKVTRPRSISVLKCFAGTDQTSMEPLKGKEERNEFSLFNTGRGRGHLLCGEGFFSNFEN